MARYANEHSAGMQRICERSDQTTTEIQSSKPVDNDRVQTEIYDVILSSYFQQVGFGQHPELAKKILSKLQELLGKDNLKEFSICTSTVSPLHELQLLFLIIVCNWKNYERACFNLHLSAN